MNRCKYCGKNHHGMVIIPSCVDVEIFWLKKSLARIKEIVERLEDVGPNPTVSHLLTEEMQEIYELAKN